MGNPRANRSNFKKSLKQIEEPQESWFARMNNYLTKNQPNMTAAEKKASGMASTYANDVVAQAQIEPGMSQVLDRNALLGTGEEYLQGPQAVQAPVQAPVQRQPIRQIQAALSAPSVYPQQALQRKGLAAPQRPTHADRLAMLDAGYGADDGYGMSW